MTSRYEQARLLGIARIAIGALILLRTTPLLAPLEIDWMRSAAPLLGWPDSGFSLAWLPDTLIRILCVLRTIAALLFMLGIWTRISGLLCGLAGYLVVAQYPLGFFFTVHLLYQAAILLAFTDSGGSLALRPASIRSPRSSIWLMRAFVASIYFWAGIYKVRPDWFDGRTFLLFYHHAGLSGPAADWLLGSQAPLPVMAIAIAVLELSLGPLLLWNKTRRVALFVAYMFHAGLEVVAHPDMLGWGMMALLVCFWRPVGGRAGDVRGS